MLSVALLAGCSLFSPPQREPAKGVMSKLPEAIPHAYRRASALVVLPPDAGPAYDTMRMAYRERPYQLGYFRDHEWAEPPARMIHKLLVQTLEQTGRFRSVLTPPDISPGAYTLRSELLELVQDYAKSPPVLRLALRVELLAPAGQSVASREIAVEERMREAKPYAGVVAANSALATALLDVAHFVLEHAH
jgi:cholesterol transport system auxiliary component